MLLLLLACQPSGKDHAPRISLRPCELPTEGQRLSARCGDLDVPEDRAAPAGRRLQLRIAVVPADGAQVSPDPLFLLAGGPGQSAVEAYPPVMGLFRKINERRDVVLVDQRGTGGSGALECPEVLRALRQSDLEGAVRSVAACAGRLPADLRQYHTAVAMEDLDAVREALGYPRINLYGGSYGTRVALAYLRQHPERLRTVILDGVAPPDWAIGANLASDAQRALDLVFQRCAEEPACSRQFPRLPERFAALLDRARRQRVALTVPHPQTASPTPLTLDEHFLADILRTLNYSVETVILLPLLIDDADRSGRLDRLAALALLVQDTPSLRLSMGMHLSAVCTEDIPFIEEADVQRSSQTYAGAWYIDLYRRMCAVWPRGDLPRGFRDPVRSPLPVLLLSGELDPVTPPANGARALGGLPRGRHLPVHGATHNVLVRGCTPKLMADFVERGDAAGLDTSCLDRFRPLSFFTSMNGPEP